MRSGDAQRAATYLHHLLQEAELIVLLEYISVPVDSLCMHVGRESA